MFGSQSFSDNAVAKSQSCSESNVRLEGNLGVTDPHFRILRLIEGSSTAKEEPCTEDFRVPFLSISVSYSLAGLHQYSSSVSPFQANTGMPAFAIAAAA